MTVEDKKVIDIISREPKSGDVTLTISEHLGWMDPHAHLVVLQDKINCYLAFLESGEVYEKYPKAVNARLIIEVAFQCAPSAAGREFLREAKTTIEKAGFVFRWRVSSGQVAN